MGLLLLCGIRCALFVCFVSVGEAGPSQNVGSVSGSVRILQTFLDMVNLALNFCVHLSVYSLHWWICSVCQSTSLSLSFSLKCGISVCSCSHHRLGVCFSLSKGKRYLLLTFITYLEYFFSYSSISTTTTALQMNKTGHFKIIKAKQILKGNKTFKLSLACCAEAGSWTQVQDSGDKRERHSKLNTKYKTMAWKAYTTNLELETRN